MHKQWYQTDFESCKGENHKQLAKASLDVLQNTSKFQTPASQVLHKVVEI